MQLAKQGGRRGHEEEDGTGAFFCDLTRNQKRELKSAISSLGFRRLTYVAYNGDKTPMGAFDAQRRPAHESSVFFGGGATQVGCARLITGRFRMPFSSCGSKSSMTSRWAGRDRGFVPLASCSGFFFRGSASTLAIRNSGNITIRT